MERWSVNTADSVESIDVHNIGVCATSRAYMGRERGLQGHISENDEAGKRGYDSAIVLLCTCDTYVGQEEHWQINMGHED